MVMRRVENWPLLLTRFIRDRSSVPFAYGTNDCMIFTADIIKAITVQGFDPAVLFRGTYSTEEEANTIIEENGGMQAFITAQLGVEADDRILMGGRGDVALLQTPFGQMAGVIDESGHRVVVPVSDEMTMVRFPITKAIFVWRY